MTEHNEQKTERKLCSMGQKTDSPCLFPATVAMGHRYPGEEAILCAYHAATEPLVDELNELGVSLSLVQAYLKATRRHTAAARLVKVLEHAEADFTERLELADKVLKDLRAAERTDTRG